jgi:hypothetical protein
LAGQPQTFAAPPPPQVMGARQVPQLSMIPQPSSIVPQFLPCAAHVVWVQPHMPVTPPPPQVIGARHGLPQSSRLPQPSDAGPH